MTMSGEVFKVTRSPGRPAEIVDLEGKPLLDPKTGRMIEMAAFAKQRAAAIPTQRAWE